MIESKNIIIVTSSNNEIKKNGHYLFSVIGELGIGKVVIWDEKHYTSNEPTLTNNNIIIFIGETKTSKLMIDSITWKYDELNMKYGWMGKRAVIYVGKKELSYEEHTKLKEIFGEQQKKIEDGSFFAQMKYLNYRITKVNKIVKIVSLLIPQLRVIVIYSLIKGKIDNDEIIKKQYKYLTNKFIAESLEDFIGVAK